MVATAPHSRFKAAGGNPMWSSSKSTETNEAPWIP
jgi:hypothetical protein